MTTPKLVLPELSVSQASKEITHNQALAIIDQLTQARVLDKDLATPPGSPANGDAYIVASSPTGAWAGKTGQIAYWLTAVNAWSFAVPLNGWLVYVNDENKHYRLESGVWVELATGGGGGATLPVVQALSSTRNLVLADINTFNVNSTTNNYTVTIQPQASEAWTADAEIHFLPSNTGDITITGGAGVSLNGVVAGSVTLNTQYGAASIKRTASDAWWVGGVVGVQPDVVGPSSATDNDIARFDGTTGKLIKAGLKYQSSVTDTTAGALVIQGGQSLITSDAAAIGFGTGAGGSVTQATSKSTAVTLNKPTGRITMNNAALAAGAYVQFSLNNTSITGNDIVVTHGAGGLGNSYRVECAFVATGQATLRVTNITAASLSEALLINFAVIKGAVA